ncbi:DNA recombination protein Rad22 [Schizosaccharomyces japonicus yFS275]|uniref:DNA recombination protein Rad22 n=1 Tax=Schizosaccharomyces japonicus (strain yFS275 / FY16936) TaxID=402676 RepID=B6JZN7_SCHJY|nr:DNA recombination protein Rad22 [Schizosaccharomyces japonicus yFS275]EEB07005.2 DNA recombination protein Rad22 [Schizosaccharomyces japonicus yFS275]
MQHQAVEERGSRFGEPYTQNEFQTLRSSLSRKLGPEYVSRRAGPGGFSVSYLESWKAIELANEIFGFNGWSSSIRSMNVDFMDENKDNGRVSMGLSVVIRVTLRDGSYHEDIGYGSIDNCRGKASAFEKCKKEGTTDGLKRALRNFGNSLGNCLYDKYYLREIGKMKPPPYHFDSNELFRRADAASYHTLRPRPSSSNGRALNSTNSPQVSRSNASPLQQNEASRKAVPSHSAHERNEMKPGDSGTKEDTSRDIEMYADEELDKIFIEDEVIAHLAVCEDAGMNTAVSIKEQVSISDVTANLSTNPNMYAQANPTRVNTGNPAPTASSAQRRKTFPMAAKTEVSNTSAPLTTPAAQLSRTNSASEGQAPSHPLAPPVNSATAAPFPPLSPAAAPAPPQFISARAAAAAQGVASAPPTTTFDPHRESPSIRKSSLVDHSRSAPVQRVAIQPTNGRSTTPTLQDRRSPLVPSNNTTVHHTPSIDHSKHTPVTRPAFRGVGMPPGASRYHRTSGAHKRPLETPHISPSTDSKSSISKGDSPSAKTSNSPNSGDKKPKTDT